MQVHVAKVSVGARSSRRHPATFLTTSSIPSTRPLQSGLGAIPEIIRVCITINGFTLVILALEILWVPNTQSVPIVASGLLHERLAQLFHVVVALWIAFSISGIPHTDIIRAVITGAPTIDSFEDSFTASGCNSKRLRGHSRHKKQQETGEQHDRVVVFL